MRNKKLREKNSGQKKNHERKKKIKKKKFKILNIKQFFPASYEDSLVVRAVCWTKKTGKLSCLLLRHLVD